MAKWIEIERKDVKVGDIIGHNATERVVTEISDGKIHTDPGTFYQVSRRKINKKVIVDTSMVSVSIGLTKVGPADLADGATLESKPLIPDEPGHCLHCGAKAYVGLWEVGCSAKCKDSQ